MPINTNLCENKVVTNKDGIIRSFQSVSIYTNGDGKKWDNKKMFDIMMEISKTSLKLLGSDLTNQITNQITKK
jgi:type II restriction enzyme